MSLREDIEHAINCNSAENGSNTPDYILAEFLTDCLAAYDKALVERERWYGRPIERNAEPVTVVTHAEVEALREQLHHATNNLDNLHLELTAAQARIAKLKAALQKIAKQKTTDEMSHADGRLGDFEGAYDMFIEDAREGLKPGPPARTFPASG